MVFTSWCVFCIVLTVTFKAHLVPALGVNKRTYIFHRIRDLLVHEDYKWGLYGNGNWAVDYLRDSNKDIYRRLYDQVINFNETDNEVLSHRVNVHERKVLTENYVYINYEDATQIFYTKNCDVVKIDDKLYETPASFALPKNSSLEHLFSQRIVDFYENGQMDRWTRKWLRKRGCAVEKTKSTAVGLLYMQSAFIAPSRK